jgi:hypothetical protein
MLQMKQMTSIDRFRASVEIIRNEAQTAGLHSGWSALHEYYQFKQGYPFIIYGLPYSGKTYFVFQMLINLSRLYGKKHFIYSPETGSGAEVLETLLCIFTGKDVRLMKDKESVNHYAMTHAEFESAYSFIRDHFYIADTPDFPKQITLEAFYKEVSKVNNEAEFTFDTCLIDPWAEIHIDQHQLHVSVSDALGMMREHDKAEKMTTIVLNHTNEIKPIYDKQHQITYDPIPMPSQMYGGQMWFRRGYSILLIYRPNPTIFGTHENETWVFVQKSKPRGYGRKGRASLTWNPSKSQFYDDGNTNTQFNEDIF